MTQITLDGIKKNNSNIYAYDLEICRVLRKERFKKPKHDHYLNFCIAADKLSFNPYADADLAMDLEKFSKTLRGLELICFNYYLEGLIHADIAKIVGKTTSRVTQILIEVRRKFKQFYGSYND